MSRLKLLMMMVGPCRMPELAAEPQQAQAIAAALAGVPVAVPLGRVIQVVGLVIESEGPTARLGDVCEIAIPHGEALKAEVVGFRERRLLLMPLDAMEGRIAPGCTVRNTGKALQVAVGPELKGRVLDAFGAPIDDRLWIAPDTFRPVLADAPPAMSRQGVNTLMPLGVRAMDATLSVGKGQRLGIFAGSGVGKSTLMGMLARNATADINVIALIGERGREVREFLDEALGEEGLKKSVVIVATGDAPAIVKIKAALTATTIAEAFRDEGKNVLLMMDSVTRVALALREVGLACGEPPATRGYTPSVFAFLPRLLERTGPAAIGSITALYAVLVEGDDMNEPIADTVRGIMDGHVVLSRELAEMGHFPAIDVLGSISRVMPNLVSETQLAQARKLRELLAVLRQNADLVSIGAYVPGGNPLLDRALALKPAIDAFLRQRVDEAPDMETVLKSLETLLNGV